ncbi:MAG: hypothetical protein ABI882_09530 [Acidobacteriota bacterium]
MCRLVKLASMSLLLMLTAFSGSSSSLQRTPAREVRILGLLDVSLLADGETISAPKTVRAGESFQVTVTTSGGGCEKGGDISVILGEAHADLMVFDTTVATRPHVACTMIYKRLAHTATVQFSRTGEAVIRVWGRRVGSDTPSFGSPTVIEHRLRVE